MRAGSITDAWHRVTPLVPEGKAGGRASFAVTFLAVPPTQRSLAYLGIDTGGTFTDFVLVSGGALAIYKTRSTPAEPSRAAMVGIDALGVPSDAAVVHGTTVATNALLERRGARTALVTTAGFEDVLQIGRQNRRHLYALEYEPIPPLVDVELRLGVVERVGVGGEIVTPLTDEEVRRVAEHVAELGVDAVAVSCLFSFLSPEHEQRLGKALERIDGLFVSLSSDVFPEFREYERSSTTVVNSYVGPVMSRYLGQFEKAMSRPLRIMQSSGGSAPVHLAQRQPVRTVLSGPAGGVIGARYVAGVAGFDRIITLDMGGTSTDVALLPGSVQVSTGHTIGGLPVGIPTIDIETVGAGGGSIAWVDSGGALRVGPLSAGADPGPACYGIGTEPTVTDANLVLGRMSATDFLGGRQSIDAGRARVAIDTIAAALDISGEEAAAGIVRVANAVMERAVRSVSLERGHDPREFTLVPFGGAGPQHACELAEGLGIVRVLVPLYPGVLSALGVAIGDTVKDYSRTVMGKAPEDAPTVEWALRDMEALGYADLEGEGYSADGLQVTRRVDARYKGQSFELDIPWPLASADAFAEVTSEFHRAHERRFGYHNPAAPVEIVTARVRVIAPSDPPPIERAALEPGPATPRGTSPAWLEGRSAEVGVYVRDELRPGQTFAGPAVVVQMDSTTVVPIGWSAEVDGYRNLLLTSDGVRS